MEDDTDHCFVAEEQCEAESQKERPEISSLGLEPRLFYRPNLIRGSCEDYLGTALNGSVDLIIDDPPYGVTELDWDKAPDWDLLATLYHNVLADSGLVYIFGKQPSLIEVYNSFSKLFDFRFELIWNRNNVPWSSNFKPLPTHENVFVFCKKGTAIESTKFYIKNVMTEGKPYSKLRKRKSPTHGTYQDTYLAETGAKRYPKSILEVPPPIGSTREYAGFPTQKPLELIQWILLASTKKGDFVLDPHAGSGTTLLAALLLSRRSIGIELHQEAYSIASDRILDAIREMPQDHVL
jgi:DNA modification methylase